MNPNTPNVYSRPGFKTIMTQNAGGFITVSAEISPAELKSIIELAGDDRLRQFGWNPDDLRAVLRGVEKP